MGSEFFKKSGVDRCGDDLAEDYPEKFHIVDLDVPAEHLRRTFAGNALALELIERAKDATRIGGDPPEWFIAAGEDANYPPIDFVCIGPDAEGKVYNLVLDGRKRVMTRRIWNARFAARKPKLPPATIRAMPHKYRKLEGAGLDALIVKASTGITVAPTLETRADRAAEFRSLSIKPAEIAKRLGLPGGEDEAKELLDWASIFSQLSPLAREAANAGRIKIGKARKLAGMTPAEQDAALAPKTRAAKPNGHARPLTPRKVAAFLGELKDERAVLLFGLTLGTVKIDTVTDRDIRAAWLRAFGGE